MMAQNRRAYHLQAQPPPILENAALHDGIASFRDVAVITTRVLTFGLAYGRHQEIFQRGARFSSNFGFAFFVQLGK